MPFVKTEKARAGGASLTSSIPQITMGAYLADGKHHKSRSISFRMTKALIEQLGWEFDGRSIKLGLAEGIGPDKGLLQIVPDPDGYKCSRPLNEDGSVSNQGLSLSVTVERLKHYVLNEVPVPSMLVQHIIDGNALIIETPDWLRFNPLSVPEEKENPRPLQRERSAGNADDRLNRQERRIAAHVIARELKRGDLRK